MNRTIRIATRQSPLALWQAEFVREKLQRVHAGLEVELVGITSRGDQILDTPLSKVGGKGLFVKELQAALLEQRADIAVHSMKDVPMELPEELHIGAICPREDPTDALVSRRYDSVEALPHGCVVGTSSLRRQCQLLRHRPDITVKFLRGNVNTRLHKLDENEYDAIILASAGLIRLGFEDRITQQLPAEFILPAGGQGAVGIELRRDDQDMSDIISPLHDLATARCVQAERALGRRLQGGCEVPMAAYAVEDPQNSRQIWMRSLVGAPDGTELLWAEGHAGLDDGVRLGTDLGTQLLDQGADRILAAVYGS